MILCHKPRTHELQKHQKSNVVGVCMAGSGIFYGWQTINLHTRFQTFLFSYAQISMVLPVQNRSMA